MPFNGVFLSKNKKLFGIDFRIIRLSGNKVQLINCYAILSHGMIYPRFQFTTGSLFLTVFLSAYIVAAFRYGDYLIGIEAGVYYAFIASLLSALLLAAISRSELSKSRLVAIVIFVFLVSLVFAFPSYVNSNLQSHIKSRAECRNARNELTMLFSKDSAFRELEVTVISRYGLCVEIHGSIPTTSDIERLRARVLAQCKCVFHSEVLYRIRVVENSKIYSAQGSNDFFVSPP